jgi:hypothetical protein
MKQDLLQGALLRLQGSILETFEAIKDEYASPANEGTVDRIASLAARLANLEGALITLQQYSQRIVETAKAEAMETSLAAARMAIAEAKSASEGESAVITEENSKTMKKVRAVQKEQKKPKKAKKKDTKE